MYVCIEPKSSGFNYVYIILSNNFVGPIFTNSISATHLQGFDSQNQTSLKFIQCFREGTYEEVGYLHFEHQLL